MKNNLEIKQYFSLFISVLIINGASSFGSICIQLAYHWGAKVIATCASSDEKLYLQTLRQKIGLQFTNSNIVLLV